MNDNHNYYYMHTDHATEFTSDGQTTVTCSRSTANPDGSNAADDPAIPDGPTTANDGSTIKPDSFNAAVPDDYDFVDPAAFPDQSQDCDHQALKKLLFDYLLHLWRTGASHRSEKDEDFDVSYYL